jgi:2-hydroxychromene-2-carboxylate isomerase
LQTANPEKDLEMPYIDYYFTVLSPYVYLAGTRLEEIAQRHATTVRYFPVHFGNLAARMGSTTMIEASDARKEYYAMDLARQARRLNMSILARPTYWPANPAPASYAVIAAQNVVANGGGGDLAGLVHGFARAVWAEDRNIADDDVVRAVLVAHGFDGATADRGMLSAAESYGANVDQAAGAGVFGVPFYIADGQKFWGQDRLDDLDHHLSLAVK